MKKTNLILAVSVIAFLLGGSALLAQDPPQESQAIVYDLDHVRPDVTPPKAVYAPNPEYTDRARRRKQALKAVGAWRFEPATKDGKPVAVRVKVEADFKLY